MSDKTSPNIIFKLEAHLPGDESAKSDFFRCRSTRNIIDYISRFDAIDKTDPQTQDVFDTYMDLTNDGAKSILNYASNRPGSTGSFNKDKFLSVEDMKKCEAEFQKTNSIIWSSVLSFTRELADKCCYNKKMAQEIIVSHLPTLFKNSHLDYENIDWFGAFHINTEHPHIHLLFWEKEPKYIDSYGKLGYNKKYTIDKECFNDFKFCINREFNSSKLSYFHLRDEIRHSMRLNYNNDKLAFNNYYSKCKHIVEQGINQYGRLQNKDKKIVDAVVKDIITNNSSLKSVYDTYTAALFKTQVEYTGLYKANKLKPPIKVQEFYENRLADLHNRLGNEFLKLMKDYGFNQRSVDGLVKKQIEESFIPNRSTKHIRIKKIVTRTMDEALRLIVDYTSHCEDEMHVSQNNLERFRREELSKGVELIHNEEEILE